LTLLLEAHHIDRFRSVIAQRLGLHLDESKSGFLAEVLRGRLDGAQSPESYLNRLGASAPSGEELRALAQELTVGETYFFRNADQFRAFGELVLRNRLDAWRTERSLRILSAGCASGEEPYSIAIAVREHLSDLSSWNIEILALDMNPSFLERARRGRYAPWSFRETPPELKERWFRPARAEFLLADEIRSMVTFQAANLIEEDLSLWRPGRFDVVFCRNVIMYFTPHHAQSVVARIARSLAPGGYLFLGHAETLRGLSHDFHLCNTHETFYYQLKDPAGVAGRPDRASELPLDQAGAPGALAPIVDAAGSWVEAIQRASGRIDALAQRSPMVPVADARASAGAGRAPDLGRALELFKRERFGEALTLVDRMSSDAARDPEVLLLRAVLLAHGGNLVDAEAACEALLRVDGLSAGAHYVAGLCREGMGDPDGAAEHDRVALYLDPGFAMPRLHLGLLSRRSGDRDAARRELEQALDLLQREDPSRLLLFGGGFGRGALVALCRAELAACGGAP
jgi:chemotaxis protein methyltransferase CheR